jgi:hypothetical protein
MKGNGLIKGKRAIVKMIVEMTSQNPKYLPRYRI